MTDPKKCQPLNCHQFKSIFEKTWMKTRVDKFVVTCSFRTQDNCCTRESETLDKVLIA